MVLVFAALACRRGENPAVSVPAGARSGDIVCRRGRGAVSALFAERASAARRFSHAGVVWVDSAGRLWVIHTEAEPDGNGRSGVRLQPYAAFAAESRRVAFYRLPVSDLVASAVADTALALLARGIPFDLDFDTATDSALYCTELVAAAVNRAAGDSLIRPAWRWRGRRYYGLDDLTSIAVPLTTEP